MCVSVSGGACARAGMGRVAAHGAEDAGSIPVRLGSPLQLGDSCCRRWEKEGALARERRDLPKWVQAEISQIRHPQPQAETRIPHALHGKMKKEKGGGGGGGKQGTGSPFIPRDTQSPCERNLWCNLGRIQLNKGPLQISEQV